MAKLLVEIEVHGRADSIVDDQGRPLGDWIGNSEQEVSVDEAYLSRLHAEDSFYSFKLVKATDE